MPHPNKYRSVGRICAYTIAAAYFLPWIDVLIVSFSGYDLHKIFKGLEGLQSFANDLAKDFGGAPAAQEKIAKPLWLYGTMLFPVLGIASAVVNKKLLHLFSAVFTLGIILWAWLSLDLGELSKGMGEAEVSIFNFIGIGLYLTVLAPFGQIFGAFTCEDNLGRDAAQAPSQAG